MNRQIYSLLLYSSIPFIFAGCMHYSSYQPPHSQTTSVWSQNTPNSNHKVDDLTQWWSQFNDPVLGQLIETAQDNSPNLLKAWAKIEQARATLTTSKASLFPSLTGSASAKRAKDGQVSNQGTGSLDASWEIDLFGKIRKQNEAAQSRIEARQDDWHDARISLAAEVADDYVQYRSCELLVAVYQNELQSMQKTEQANSQMVKAGFTAPMDGALSRANLASTQMNLLNQQKQCDLLVKTLVQVTGMQETALRPLLNSGKSKSLPKPALFNVSDVPAQMLQHRPDIAALEREVYATYAEIGSAQADRYPSLSLTGVISTVLTGGTSAASWSFGPALSLPIFDAGQKKAAVESAKATYVSAIADYQSGVRSAVSEVEQALVQLNSIAAQEQASENSVREYENYFNALQLSWKAGNTNLLDLESARRSSLSAQMSQIELQTSRVQQWIALYKAMGGGWQKNAVVTQPETSLKDINF